MRNKKVIVGFSGGADSAAAALILKNKGYEVLGVTFDFFGDEPLLKKASALAKKIGIRHECIKRQLEFREKVIKPFISEYLRGYTLSLIHISGNYSGKETGHQRFTNESGCPRLSC